MEKTLFLIILLSGCSSKQPSPIDEYLTLYQPSNEIKLDKQIDNFVALYKDLKHLSAAEQVKKTYAEDFYFNDTLVTLRKRKELIIYLEATQKQLRSIDFKVLNILTKGDDIFLHWDMQTKFEVLGVSRDVRSLGMSHLRFNKKGKIILHQDYWDSSNGFFQHIPLLGDVINWIKNGLH